jgi:ABC-type multidrug transport system ATPase subunit
MKITLTNAGKRFNRDWIFRHFNYEFVSGRSYALTGPNGSGKSTLLQVLAGSLSASEGTVGYSLPSTQNGLVDPENIFRYFSLAAPYLQVVEEMNLLEFLRFHSKFKPFLPGINAKEIISLTGLSGSAGKQIRYFSSGMKQRVKLAQSILSDTPVVLLDEPCGNLDSEGITLYQQLIDQYGRSRLMVVASNDQQEYDFCEAKIDLMEYKGLIAGLQ